MGRPTIQCETVSQVKKCSIISPNTRSISAGRQVISSRRFPPPWSVDEANSNLERASSRLLGGPRRLRFGGLSQHPCP